MNLPAITRLGLGKYVASDSAAARATMVTRLQHFSQCGYQSANLAIRHCLDSPARHLAEVRASDCDASILWPQILRQAETVLGALSTTSSARSDPDQTGANQYAMATYIGEQGYASVWREAPHQVPKAPVPNYIQELLDDFEPCAPEGRLSGALDYYCRRAEAFESTMAFAGWELAVCAFEKDAWDPVDFAVTGFFGALRWTAVFGSHDCWNQFLDEPVAPAFSPCDDSFPSRWRLDLLVDDTDEVFDWELDDLLVHRRLPEVRSAMTGWLSPGTILVRPQVPGSVLLPDEFRSLVLPAPVKSPEAVDATPRQQTAACGLKCSGQPETLGVEAAGSV